MADAVEVILRSDGRPPGHQMGATESRHALRWCRGGNERLGRAVGSCSRGQPVDPPRSVVESRRELGILVAPPRSVPYASATKSSRRDDPHRSPPRVHVGSRARVDTRVGRGKALSLLVSVLDRTSIGEDGFDSLAEPLPSHCTEGARAWCGPRRAPARGHLRLQSTGELMHGRLKGTIGIASRLT
jgi:hypothetical protein